jgi:nitroreductase
METLEAIRTRRSVSKMRFDVLPTRTQIEQIIDAAIWAPNHRRTEPWRFVVIAGDARKELGEIFAQLSKQSLPDVDEDYLNRDRAKPLRAPVLIAVTSDAGTDEVMTHENMAATAAAIQNMLLAAHAIGLGAQWRTGDLSYHPLVNQFLGVPEDAKFMGCVYLGHPDPDLPPKQRNRTSALERTEWRGELPE